jgi:hypothetical protein
MKQFALMIAVLLLAVAIVKVCARDVYCPLHSYASCYNTGEIAPTGSNAQKWHCTCNDDVWVAPEAPSYSTTPAPPAPAQPGISSEDSAKLGAALGAIVAQKRAQRAQERNDLTAVVFCRQNPSGSWTFPGKAPMTCENLNRNLLAYCAVNPKKAICKNVAKFGTVPINAAVSAQGWSEDEKYIWGFYNSLPEDDKSYVLEFCPANPTEKALLPHAKVLAGQPPDRSLGCSYWLSAKAKQSTRP